MAPIHKSTGRQTQVRMGGRRQKWSEKAESGKWSDLVQDGHKWKEIVEKAKSVPEL